MIGDMCARIVTTRCTQGRWEKEHTCEQQESNAMRRKETGDRNVASVEEEGECRAGY